MGTWYPGFRGYPDLHLECDRGAAGKYGGRAQRRRPSDRLPHRLRRLGRSGAVVLLLEMAGAVGAAAQGEMRAPLQEAIHDRLRQISIMHDIAPGRRGFVGRDEDRALGEVALVDDLVEYVRRVGGVVRVERRLQASARRGA